MRQTWILIIISILLLFSTSVTFSLLVYMIFMLWFGKKSFLSTIFLTIKVHPSNKTNLDSHNNSIFLWFSMAIMFSALGYTILMFWFGKKSFPSTIFLTIKVYPSNEITLDFHNNLYSFYDWALHHLPFIEKNDTDALVW